MVAYFGCYDFNDEWLLVEMLLNVAGSEIDWESMVVPDDELDEENWQCPYMEQYLNEDGTAKICELYDEPDPDVKPCRVVFFIYKEGSRLLQTAYGNFELTPAQPMPKRLEGIVEFDEED